MTTIPETGDFDKFQKWFDGLDKKNMQADIIWNHFQRYYIMPFKRKRKAISQPSEQSAVDWKSLREKFFKECTINDSIDGTKIRIDFAPHDLFEWFKSNAASAVQGKEDFQNKVFDWCIQCFGEEITHDVVERNHRFLEEALELVQSTGATKSECHQLVDYVFNRDTGEANQELGGVMVTLAALSNAVGLQMDKAGDIEVKRICGKIERIREKQAAKPKHSPLPQSPTPNNIEQNEDEHYDGRMGHDPTYG